MNVVGRRICGLFGSGCSCGAGVVEPLKFGGDMATLDDFLLRSETVIGELRKENRNLLEAKTELDAIWARQMIDKLTMELEIIAKEVRKKTEDV